MTFDRRARDAHTNADALPSVQQLLRDLRRALTSGEPMVDVPVVLAGRGPVTARAGTVRQHVLDTLEGLTATGKVERDEARVLVERFALDGDLRTAAEIQTDYGFGRETMRTRYQAAMEALADQLAELPLVLRPPVELDHAERELVTAAVLSEERHLPTMPEAQLRYVHERVRHRVLGQEPPLPPRQGRAEDRRLQRVADQLAARVEDRVDRGGRIASFPPPSAAELERVRDWIAAGRPLDEAGPELSRCLVAVTLHGRSEDVDVRRPPVGEGDDREEAFLDIEASLLELPPALQLAAVKTARDIATTGQDWAIALLLHYYLAEALGDRAFPAAAEHVMRAVTDPIKQILMPDPAGTAFLAEMYLLRRYNARVGLHFGRGPTALADLRAHLRSFVAYSTRFPEGIDFFEGMRIYQALLDTEIAAALAGADPEEGRTFFNEMLERIKIQPAEPLDEKVERSLRGCRADLNALWRRDPDLDRRAIAGRLAIRISGTTRESKIGSALIVRRWSEPR